MPSSVNRFFIVQFPLRVNWTPNRRVAKFWGQRRYPQDDAKVPQPYPQEKLAVNGRLWTSENKKAP
ncbi:hypothetical protein J2X09_005328 [Hydrogenophaga laconesensis]|uniref:Uncharacterized protein n=1 Tax=Hydrogenophaga laconesensis TaxID=1805971 RepID=A0ABU1VJE3_9BURK|nr:hypothetical protein [Hydrogenophaga laconesensis]